MGTDVGRQSKIVFPSTMTEYFSYTVFSGMTGTTHPALIIIDTSFMVSSPSDSWAKKLELNHFLYKSIVLLYNGVRIEMGWFLELQNSHWFFRICFCSTYWRALNHVDTQIVLEVAFNLECSGTKPGDNPSKTKKDLINCPVCGKDISECFAMVIFAFTSTLPLSRKAFEWST